MRRAKAYSSSSSVVIGVFTLS